MEKVKLIYNPVSGQAQFKNNLDYVVQYFQKKGKQIVPYRTEDNLSTFRAAYQIEKDEYERVLVAGGDGTIHQVVNGLLLKGIDLPLGIFPFGTANDVANHLGLTRNIGDLCEILVGNNYLEIDLGLVNHNRYFVNVISAGLMTEVSQKTEISVKNNLGRLAYYLKGLEQLPKFRFINISMESAEYNYLGEALLFLVMNGRAAGGFSKIAPLAWMNDGLLDVFIFKPASLPEIVPLFIRLIKGEHLHSPQIIHFQTSDLKINCLEKISSDLDGEGGPFFPLQITCLPHKLKMLLPNDSLYS